MLEFFGCDAVKVERAIFLHAIGGCQGSAEPAAGSGSTAAYGTGVRASGSTSRGDTARWGDVRTGT
jgi:hypothetical protein